MDVLFSSLVRRFRVTTVCTLSWGPQDLYTKYTHFLGMANLQMLQHHLLYKVHGQMSLKQITRVHVHTYLCTRVHTHTS